jgi:alkylation response protein AidB-like acyl-CoA dehydrogenase
MSTTGQDTALYELPQELRDLRDTIRAIAQEQVAPRAAELDEKAEYSWELRKLFAEHDLFALPFDEEYGGTGTGAIMLCMAVEEISKACASSGLMVLCNDLGTLPIRLFGNEEQKQRFLPKCATGEWQPAFALSEPEAGSDPGGMRTTAQRDGDEYILNGAKNWITNLGVAQFYVVFAKTDPKAGRAKGVSAFVVDADSEGFSIGKLEHKMGMRSSPTGQPIFENVRVPAENMLGEEGEGMRVALGTLDHSRLGVAAQALGIAQGATDYANSYAWEREQFGKPIAEFQGISFKLADMQTRCGAARELLYQAACKSDRGDKDVGSYSAMAKLFCSDTAMYCTTEAVQVLGGYGYVKEYPVERMMRDAKLTQIYEGTNEIQRLVVARSMAPRR